MGAWKKGVAMFAKLAFREFFFQSTRNRRGINHPSQRIYKLVIDSHRQSGQSRTESLMLASGNVSKIFATGKVFFIFFLARKSPRELLSFGEHRRRIKKKGQTYPMGKWFSVRFRTFFISSGKSWEETFIIAPLAKTEMPTESHQVSLKESQRETFVPLISAFTPSIKVFLLREVFRTPKKGLVGERKK